jgi:hypothetical protein
MTKWRLSFNTNLDSNDLSCLFLKEVYLPLGLKASALKIFLEGSKHLYFKDHKVWDLSCYIHFEASKCYDRIFGDCWSDIENDYLSLFVDAFINFLDGEIFITEDFLRLAEIDWAVVGAEIAVRVARTYDTCFYSDSSCGVLYCMPTILWTPVRFAWEKPLYEKVSISCNMSFDCCKGYALLKYGQARYLLGSAVVGSRQSK